MGQYWIPANLDKKEFIMPHKLGSGLKLWEQIAADHVGKALIILTAAEREPRGGGDFDLDDNWHGPERTFPEHNSSPGPIPEYYPLVAKRTIGRWAGDRIVIVGDYAKDEDLPSFPHFAEVYARCHEFVEGDEEQPRPREFYWTDVSDDVIQVLEHELGGKFIGSGWREWLSREQLQVERNAKDLAKAAGYNFSDKKSMETLETPTVERHDLFTIKIGQWKMTIFVGEQ